MAKHKQIDVKKIATDNPAVNMDHLDQVFAVLTELRKSGIQPKRYGLTLPFSKEVQVQPTGEEDPRTVHLGR
jgi:hypothetical protein